jgi:hypothetical protein
VLRVEETGAMRIRCRKKRRNQKITKPLKGSKKARKAREED